MKKLLAVLGHCLLFSTLSFGQSELPTYVFAISAQQAEHWYRNPSDTLDVSVLGSPVDSFRFTAEEQPRQAGHYLYIRPEFENLSINLRSYYTSKLEVRNNDRDLALELIDERGQARKDGRIKIGKKNIPFDENTKTYRRKNWAKDGLLTVVIDQDTLFYQLTGSSGRPLLARKIRYWRRGAVVYWLTSPIRWVENTYHYLKRGIGRGNWHFYRDPLAFLKRERGFRGYMAANQPLYRPGDTLKLKAYLANYKGKPWSKKVLLNIRTRRPGSYRYQVYTDSILTTDDPGNFTFLWPLADTLPQDQEYHMVLSHPRRDQFETLQHTFRLEDYELDEAAFSLTLPQKRFHRGEKIAVQAEGRDQNDKIVAGAEVKLTLITTAIRQIYPDSLTVPDTLWTSRQSLSDRETTQLLIPDSIFPPADLEVKLLATFIHPSGELHLKEQDFNFYHLQDKLILQIAGDSLVAGLERNGQAQATTALLSRYGVRSEGLPRQIDTISLPYREVLRPFFKQYILESGGLKTVLQAGYDYDSQVQVQGRWQPDTLSLSFINPRRLNVTWLLQSRTQEIRRGSFSKAGGTVKIPVGNQRQWKLNYQYFWQSPISEEQTIYRLDKKLEVAIEQPLRVSPGETVQIKLNVQDPYGRPAAGVQLAAAAVNAQFENTRLAYEPPSILYKTTRDPFVVENFRIYPQESREMSPISVSPAWHRKLKLHPYPFYQMRFQNPGVWTAWDTLTQDTFYRKVAQFTPYLIRQGENVPVLLVFLNDELTYYYGSDDHPPYSFAGRPGYNRISLRTRQAAYTLDSVWLEAGKKLELAINLDLFQDGMSGVTLDRKPLPAHWTDQEKYILARQLLVLDSGHPKEEQYFWDRPTNIHRLDNWPYRQNEVVIGPFRTNAELHHVLRGKWEKTLLFEPGFRYQIDASRERLYEWERSKKLAHEILPATALPPVPGQLIYRPEDIRRTAVPIAPQVPYYRGGLTRYPGKARFRGLNVPDEVDSLSVLAVLIVSEKGQIIMLSPNRPNADGLAAGSHRVLLLREDGWVQPATVSLRANSTLALDFSQPVFVREDTENWLDSLSTKRQAPPGSRPKDFRFTNPYENYGRIIQGQITDRDGEPLIGASILVKGTTIGTVTDIDGYYSLRVPEGSSEIMVNYAGFSSQELEMGASRQIDVQLEEEAMALDEVIVTGLGSRRMASTSSSALKLEGRAVGVNGSGQTDLLTSSPDLEGQDQNSSLRNQFRDYAFWQPKLITDKKGEAFFQATFPDNVTAWDTYVLGMDRKRRAGIGLARTQVWKSLTARLNVPRFMIAGDQANIVGQAVNYTEDTLQITTFFRREEREVSRKEHRLITSLTDTYRLQARKAVDSIQLTYGLEQGNYLDGEQRDIPLFPQGSLETEGYFMVLHGDTTIELSFTKDLPVDVFVADNTLPLLLEDLDYLKNYPHECMEQTASRLIALSLEKQIRQKLQEPFAGEQRSKKLLQKLEKAQNANGSWGWWAGGEGSLWITRHVLEAIHLTQAGGERSEALEKGIRYLMNELPQINAGDQLLALDFLSAIQQNLDYAAYLQAIDSLPLSLHDRLLTIRIRQRAELPYQLDTLDRYRQQTLYGAHYWGEKRPIWFYRRFDHPIATTLIAYELLREVGRTQETRAVQQYFLENRGIGQPGGRCAWYNTYETARVLATILPDLLGDEPVIRKNQLSLGAVQLDEFPYRGRQSGTRQLKVQKSGTGPLYLTAYQQYHNTQAEAKTDIFRITSRLIQNEREVDRLEKGQTAALAVTLQTNADAEYVMLEIPIPAGCSYSDRSPSWHKLEDHREYRREKAVIYCRALSTGTHTFFIDLEARFSGNFNLNPARAEQMYFPVLYGRNGMKGVQIE